MKKYDSVIFSLLLALVLLLASVLFSMMGEVSVEVEGGIDYDSQLAAAPVAPVVTPSTTVPATVPTTAVPEKDEPQVPAAEDTTAAKDTEDKNTLPQTKEEILRQYTLVMDKAKADAPAFSKVEYQNIPPEKAQFDGKVFNTLLPLLNRFFKDEETARANPEAKAKGDPMEWFPIYHCEKGCMLTDVSAIKSAQCTELPDGNVKLVIVLNDEVNCEPPAAGSTSCDSAIGSMFTPIEMKTVRDTLENDGAIKFIAKDINFNLTYTDCTAELTYNPDTNEIVTLDQFMHLNIDIVSGKVVGISAVGKAVLDNYMYISGFEY